MVVSLFGILAGAPLRAQERSVLSLLPVDDRVLAAGYAQTGTLHAEDDYALPNGQAVQAWELRGAAGEGLVIELQSEDFDALLYVIGPGLEEALSDDDGGEACNARIDLVLPADGPYRVVVSSFAGSGGTFTVSAANEAGPRRDDDACGGADGGFYDWSLEDVPTEGRVLVDGDVVESQLTTDDFQLSGGAPAKGWTILGTAGMTLTVDMISEDFDALLYGGGPGFPDMLVDDDGAGGCNARLTFTFPEDGEYVLVATNIFSTAEGAFTLRVATDPPPPSGAECDMGLPGMFGDMSSAYADLVPTGSIGPDEERLGTLQAGAETLADGSYVAVWSLEVEAGERLTVDLIADGFDALLTLTGPDDFFENDDDSLGSCNARITTVFPASGEYRVIVNSVAAAAEGSYVLRAMRESGPTTPGSCS